MDIQNSERRNSEFALLESQRTLESRRRQVLKANQWADQAQRERIHLCSILETKDQLHKESYARNYQKNWRIEKTLLSGRKYWKNNEDWKIFYAAWSGITNSESILLRSWFAEQLWRTNVLHLALITSISRMHSREVGMLLNTGEDVSILENVFDRQHVQRYSDELHNDSRNLTTWLAMLRKELRILGAKNHCNQYFHRAFSAKSKEKKSRRQRSLMSMINHAVGIGTCTQSMTIPSYLHRICICKKSLTKRNFKAGSWISKLKFAQKRRISRAYCSGSRKSKQPACWTTSSIQNQLQEKISLILKNWIWWWRQNWNGATLLLIWSTKLPSVEPWQNTKGEKLLHRAEDWRMFSLEYRWLLFKKRRL